MRIHVLVEGPSEKALLESWLPRFLPHGHTFKIIQHKGKGRIPGDPSSAPDPRRQGLLDQLPAKLRAYGKSLRPETDRVLVPVDLDDDDCLVLKNRMVHLLDYCDPPPTVLFRIPIEETEAFYLGDPPGIRKALGKCRKGKMSSYVQDGICGTWELYSDVIGENREAKVEWAERMGPYLTVQWEGAGANRSPSFRQFCMGLLKLAGERAG
ncbi:MAG: hypothetical protein AB1646_15315 [Thermodesulfobacteriota bacterium]